MPRSEVEGFQDLDADLDLLDRGRRQGDPDRVADSLGQQRTEGDGRFDGALKSWSRLGDTKMQRVIAGVRKKLVGAAP